MFHEPNVKLALCIVLTLFFICLWPTLARVLFLSKHPGSMKHTEGTCRKPEKLNNKEGHKNGFLSGIKTTNFSAEGRSGCLICESTRHFRCILYFQKPPWTSLACFNNAVAIRWPFLFATRKANSNLGVYLFWLKLGSGFDIVAKVNFHASMEAGGDTNQSRIFWGW